MSFRIFLKNTKPLNFKRAFSRKPDDKSSSRDVFRLLARHLWPDNKTTIFRIVFALVSLIISKIVAVKVPFIFKHAIDGLDEKTAGKIESKRDLLVITPLLLLVGWGIARTTSSLFYELRSAIFAPVAQSAVRKLTCRTFSHLHKMDSAFHLKQNSGALSRAIHRGQSSFQYIINSMIFNVLPTIFEIALVCTLLGTNCGVAYSAISMSTIVIYSVFTLVVTKWRTRIRQTLNTLDSKISSNAIDTFINFETIKYFNNEDYEVERHNNLLKDYHDVASKVQTSLAFLNWGQNLIFTTGLTTVMVMACKGVMAGAMTVGDLVMVNGLLFQLSGPLHFIGSTYREIKQSLVDLQSMVALLNVIPSIRELDGAPVTKFKSSNLSFKNVKFGYIPYNLIINDLSFDLPFGKSIALVGLSGSGKSTVMRLLYRFYDPLSGRITIDGNDISKISLGCVRKAIGIVPQDVVLFNDTIYYNIIYGNPNASEEEVHSAAKKAKIHESILKMPYGYDTQVGERGIKISGGEKQRIAIARMILKDPLIIICDEATSSLDVETEAEIMNSIKEFAQNKAAIYIAHRLSAISDVDEILVMQEGRIVEKGSYYSLMSIKNGKFLKMWEKQTKNIK